ncbi:MAG: hypothetical protein GY877_12355, partial [Hyphomicrobium sp.]|nr:hypothetical protein [Hyphomicrobium sp.]
FTTELEAAGEEVTSMKILKKILTPEQWKQFEHEQIDNAGNFFTRFIKSFDNIQTGGENAKKDVYLESVLKGIDDIGADIDAKGKIVGEIEKLKREYREKTEDLVKEVRDGTKTSDQAEEAIKKYGEAFSKALSDSSDFKWTDNSLERAYRAELLTVERMEDIVKKTIKANERLLLGVSKSHNLESAKEAYKAIQAERKALQENIKKGLVYDGQAALETELLDDREAPLCAFFKNAGLDICNPEKQKKEFEDFKKDLKHFFDVRSSEVDRLISEMEADDQSL